jgi:hypothetical protein
VILENKYHLSLQMCAVNTQLLWGYRSKPTGGIILIAQTIFLWQTDARSIEGKPLISLMISGPKGVMGDLAKLVIRLPGTAVIPYQEVQDCSQIKSPLHQRKKGQPEGDGEVAPCGPWALSPTS